MPEFIYDWLRRTHTAHADVVAAGSSLVMSLRCFSFHPEVKLALKVCAHAASALALGSLEQRVSSGLVSRTRVRAARSGRAWARDPHTYPQSRSVRCRRSRRVRPKTCDNER
jgi:hypothetical protein